jgi:hypothetical protein
MHADVNQIVLHFPISHIYTAVVGRQLLRHESRAGGRNIILQANRTQHLMYDTIMEALWSGVFTEQ